MKDYMNYACECARHGITNKEGGPFGAVIVDNFGNVISRGNNKVIANNDPTAHAEIVAIRNAAKAINNYDLSGLILYTTCEPCPMCLSAIIWSNIKVVYYGMTRQDADAIGFRDNMIYEYLDGKGEDVVHLHQLDAEECEKIFKEYLVCDRQTY